MASTNLNDLLQQAEMMCPLDGDSELPKLNRNIQQLLSAGQRLQSSASSSQDNEKVGVLVLNK